jgi:prevent-host-death family protein
MNEPSEVSVAAARNAFSDLVHRVSVRGEVVYLTRHGRRAAAIVPLHIAEVYDEEENA